jgi:hypothetical protein
VWVIVVTVISVRIAPPPRKAEAADEDIIRESVMAPKTATAKAIATELATGETSPTETGTAVESATAEASPVETTTAATVAASAPAVATRPPCLSECERGKAY